MVQMNQTMPEANPMYVDPTISRVLSLGINPNPTPPKMSIILEGLNITLQPDGQIALYTERGLFACECMGKKVESLPEGAIKKASLREESKAVSIWQHGKAFYTKRRALITQLKVADYTSPYGGDDDFNTDELTPREREGFCGIYHREDPCIDDENDELEKTSLPMILPDEKKGDDDD